MSRVLFILAFVGIFLCSSCLMRKTEYVKDMSPDSLYNIKAVEAIKIQPADRVSITVHSKNIELAAPFNTSLGGYTLALEAEILKGINADNSFEKGYLVDPQGYIDFPILGKIKIAGLSVDEVSKSISKLIKDNNYIDDPLVKVNLLNFKILTLGTIQNLVIPVPEGKMTLMEAIVLAGGLQVNSDESRVMVIREENGERKMIVNNVAKYDVFNSEGYQLKQNDIVYVPPRYKETSPGFNSFWQIAGTLFGLISLTFTGLVLLRNNNGK